jgi:phage-related protein
LRDNNYTLYTRGGEGIFFVVACPLYGTLSSEVVQYRRPVAMPLSRSLGNGLWEVRTALPGGRIARTLFCVRDRVILVLSGFIKKTHKSPDEELALARKRMKEFIP